MKNSANQNDRLQMQRSDFKFFSPVPTRWADADAFGHVNNALYPRYIESGRIEYLHQLLGMEFVPSIKSALILADLRITFLQQVHHPETLDVATRITRLGNSSLELNAAIFRSEEAEPVIVSTAICVWFDYSENRSCPIPQPERDKIANFEGI